MNLLAELDWEKNAVGACGMWHKLRNYFISAATYADLSPDLRVRQQVNRGLSHRPALTSHQWFHTFWKPLGVSPVLADFLYTHLQSYSGLDVAKLQPNDRLDEDLQWTLICWFDWQLELCEDVLEQFGVDVSDALDMNELTTVEELVVFLHYHIPAVGKP